MEVKGSPVAPSAMTYTMLLIDLDEMAIVKNIPFTTPFAGFAVEYAGIMEDEIILSGKTSPTTEFAKASKYYIYEYDAKKSALQVVRFKGNNLVYSKSYTPEELASKISAVPGVKGKTTTTAYINYKSVYEYNGQLFINGQCFTAASNVSVMGGGQGSSDNVILLHFGANGDLITTYVYPFEGYLGSYCDMNKAGTHMYWTILDYESKDGLIYAPLLSVSKIDIAARKAGAVVNFDQKKSIRLNLNTPILYKKQNEYIAFLGSTKPGILWFGRINFE
jgi:hypothetical protein